MKLIKLTGIATLFLLTTAATCKKDNDNPKAVSLPVIVDFSNFPTSNTTSFTSNGVTFGGANARDNAGNWIDCALTDGVGFSYDAQYGGIGIWSPDFNSLIADVSKLPAIQKISVHLSDNCGTCTSISLCDGNNVIASIPSSKMTPDTTLVLNVGGNKATSLHINSLEAIVKSVKIE